MWTQSPSVTDGRTDRITITDTVQRVASHGKNYDSILYTIEVMANFLAKFSNFSLVWQQGSSEQSLTDTIKLADLENPLVGVSICGVSPAQAELLPILC